MESMKDKVCLVTGATAGIGRETAVALAAAGAEVIVGGRDTQRAEEAVAYIVEKTGSTKINYVLADFSDLNQVRAMANTVANKWPRLDVLVNNAGAFFNRRTLTEYGVEKTFLVNHLAPFLLTNLLMEPLLAAAPARIVNVSSDAHKYGSLDFDDLEMKRGYFSMKAYARSKLANLLFTYELARRIPAEKITINALHPGHVATDIWRTNFPLVGSVLKWVMGFIAISPEKGSETSIYLASSPEVAGTTGAYYDKRQSIESSPLSRDEELAGQLWEVCEGLTGQESASVGR
jgi:retinol dehydrogenase 12